MIKAVEELRRRRIRGVGKVGWVPRRRNGSAFYAHFLYLMSRHEFVILSHSPQCRATRMLQLLFLRTRRDIWRTPNYRSSLAPSTRMGGDVRWGEGAQTHGFRKES